MSTLSPEVERGRCAGFTLVETLVALAVAGLFLSSFAQAVSGAWRAARTPMDVTSAIVLARAAALDAPSGAFRTAAEQGFRIERSSLPIDVRIETSDLAPALSTADDLPPEPQATPDAMRLAEPAALVAASQRPKMTLHAVTIVVATPLGRRIRFDSIKAEDAP